ncbi:unnamed protein product [Ophioblennius macclurei]
MANGHVELHGGDSLVPESPESDDDMKDSVEFRLLMAYAARRRPAPKDAKTQNGDAANGDALKNGEAGEGKTPTTIVAPKRKKKKGWKRLGSIFKCIAPQNEEKEAEPQSEEEELHMAAMKPDSIENRCLRPEAPSAGEADPMALLASRLVSLSDEIPFVPPEIETDHPEGEERRELEVVIGLLLRDAGDRLNEKELLDAGVAAELFWDYGFFRSLLNAVLRRMGLRSADPDAPGPQASHATQIAVTCEVASRLSAVRSLPQRRLMDHGARYLQDYYSPWAHQQGGYEEALAEDDDEEVQ